MYNGEFELFCALGKDILEDYENAIDWEELRDIYIHNRDLFYAILNDPENIINELGFEEFIKQYEEAQSEIDKIPADNINYGISDPYCVVAANLANDNCPDEILHCGSESESENEDSVDQSIEIYSEDNTDDDSSDSIRERSLSSDNSDLEDFTEELGSLRLNDFQASATGEVYYSSRSNNLSIDDFLISPTGEIYYCG